MPALPPRQMMSRMAENPLLSALVVGTATGVVAFAVIAYRDYRAYVAMGPHGLPDTFSGWTKQLKMSKFARKDVTVPALYTDSSDIAKKLGPNAETSFISEPLQPRDGARPTVPSFVAPQRQVSEIASEERKQQMSSHLERLVKANPELLKSGLSVLEGPVPALQLSENVAAPAYLKVTRGEIAHIHPPDGSTHAVLSLADSKEVIEKGWGQRHRLSGGLLQWSYTLLYAPRNGGERKVWEEIVNAAVKFSTAELGNVNIDL